MATITFRTSHEVDQALTALAAEAGDRSQAIREAILTAHRLKEAERLRAEAVFLANDDGDVAEVRAVLADMEALRAW